jgi:hypothetical protein
MKMLNIRRENRENKNEIKKNKDENKENKNENKEIRKENKTENRENKKENNRRIRCESSNLLDYNYSIRKCVKLLNFL